MASDKISYWFDSEIQPHEEELRGYLSRRVSEWHEVEDIIQESFQRIIEVRSKQPIRTPKNLLFKIAKNLMIDWIRKKSVANTYPTEEIEVLSVGESSEEPHHQACQREEIEVLMEVLQTLPPKCRTILLLRRYENLSYKEIAERLNVSINTVDSQLARGLKKCTQALVSRGVKR